jgi:hypothetical protein
MKDRVSDQKPFDMTLRLWSDSIPLDFVTSQTGLKVGRIHRLGEPREVRGRVIKDIVDRHSVSLARASGTEEDVLDWLRSTLRAVGSDQQLVKELRAGQIEGLLWISRLRGDDGSSMPSIEPDLVGLASEKALRIFLENYTDFGEEGAPKREWLPA